MKRGVGGLYMWLSPLIQLTSVCSKPPLTQSLLPDIRALPVNANGTSLLGRQGAPLCQKKWIRPKWKFTLARTLITQTYEAVHTELQWKDAHLWSAERDGDSNQPSSKMDTHTHTHPATHPIKLGNNRPIADGATCLEVVYAWNNVKMKGKKTGEEEPLNAVRPPAAGMKMFSRLKWFSWNHSGSLNTMGHGSVFVLSPWLEENHQLMSGGRKMQTARLPCISLQTIPSAAALSRKIQ